MIGREQLRRALDDLVGQLRGDFAEELHEVGFVTEDFDLEVAVDLVLAEPGVEVGEGVLVTLTLVCLPVRVAMVTPEAEV